MASHSHIGAERLAPSLDDIAALAESERSRLMPALGRYLEGIPFRIEEFADDEVLAAMGIENPFELLGLYHGGSLLAEETAATGTMPALIFLYRRPMLDYWCETGEPLGRVVRHVLIHEIGHHFGLSDDDMERIEAATD
ncbi:metallopeptidase family protein [Ferrovibrio sp.]|uniref:metallopeptidase family protein n=1 Tax=Ferrovibrio sp. TaxID=1917215 RepID=UPI0025C367A4|nr:metallopeptidase family protein [Ferrovibrio sp.]